MLQNVINIFNSKSIHTSIEYNQCQEYGALLLVEHKHQLLCECICRLSLRG